MPLLNYTTAKDVEVTIGEIQRILAQAGASKIMADYEEGIIARISFAIIVDGKSLGFRLPCDWRPVQAVLVAQKAKLKSRGIRHDKIKVDQIQSVRIAWRIVKDWVEAQMAMIEMEMAKTEEVFLPYLVTASGRTLYEQLAKNQFLLGDGK